MGIRTHWYNDEKTAIRYYFTGIWTWTECFAAVDQAVEMLDSVQHPVVLIIDMRDNQHVPSLSPQALSGMANLPTMAHPNTAFLVLVGARLVVKTTFEVFRRLFPSAAARYRVVDSIGEAEALMSEARKG
jgi:hypothetical protein